MAKRENSTTIEVRSRGIVRDQRDVVTTARQTRALAQTRPDFLRRFSTARDRAWQPHALQELRLCRPSHQDRRTHRLRSTRRHRSKWLHARAAWTHGDGHAFPRKDAHLAKRSCDSQSVLGRDSRESLDRQSNSPHQPRDSTDIQSALFDARSRSVRDSPQTLARELVESRTSCVIYRNLVINFAPGSVNANTLS